MNDSNKAKKIYMCVSDFQLKKKKTRHGRSIKIFYIENAFFTTFSTISAYLTIFCSHFTIKCLGSGQKPR